MKTKIGGIVQTNNLARLSLASTPEQVRIPGKLLAALGREQINVQFIIQCRDPNENDLLTFCIDRDDQAVAEQVLHSLQEDQVVQFFEIDPQVACLGIYGPDFRIRAGLAGRLMHTLEASGIDIQAVSTSLSTFSMVIPSSQVEQALTIIHQDFDLP